MFAEHPADIVVCVHAAFVRPAVRAVRERGRSLLPAGIVTVEGRVGIGDPNNAWNLELFGQNLFDEDYLQVGFNGPFQVDENDDSVSVYNAFLGAPRTYGVTVRYSF